LDNTAIQQVYQILVNLALKEKYAEEVQVIIWKIAYLVTNVYLVLDIMNIIYQIHPILLSLVKIIPIKMRKVNLHVSHVMLDIIANVVMEIQRDVLNKQNVLQEHIVKKIRVPLIAFHATMEHIAL